MKAADAIWIATALLHQEHPDAADFRVSEIIERTLAEELTDALPTTIQTHVSRHSVANLEPRYATLRMLQETAPGRRRLHWPSDPYHPGRQGAPDQAGTRFAPMPDDLPARFRPLLDWYANQQRVSTAQPSDDALLSLEGAGSGLWRDEPADAYVRRLRESW
jgi:hypothetical protein